MKRESRYYGFSDQQGRERYMKVTYILHFSNSGELVDVRNEYNFSVEKQSECFEHFKNKYSA